MMEEGAYKSRSDVNPRSSILRLRMLCVCVFCAITIQQTAAQTTAPADEIRRGMSMADPPETRYTRWFDNLAKQIEPELHGESSRLDVYLRFFEREIVREPRLFAFKVSAVRVEGQTRVIGVAEYQEQVDTLVRLLNSLKLDPVNASIELTPTKRTNGTHFAAVKSTSAFLFASPEEKSEKVTEALAGEPVWVLDASAGGMRLLVHAADGYLGWIDAAAVEPISSALFTQLLNEKPTRSTAQLETAITDALSRKGKPYVWGGRSDDGLDCSGLVQQAFDAAGVMLPRDAEQQAICGKLVAMRHHREALRRGDVLFFLGRRGFVAHTGIYLGDGQFIEAADEGVQISSLRDGDANFKPKRVKEFCFAKRILD